MEHRSHSISNSSGTTDSRQETAFPQSHPRPQHDYHFSRPEILTIHSTDGLQTHGEALTREEAHKNGEPRQWPWIARLGVAHFQDAGKYVMVAQYGAGILFAVADKPAGPFEWHHRKDMTETIGTPNTGDQTVFTDEDKGKYYLAASNLYGWESSYAYYLVADDIRGRYLNQPDPGPCPSHRGQLHDARHGDPHRGRGGTDQGPQDTPRLLIKAG